MRGEVGLASTSRNPRGACDANCIVPASNGPASDMVERDHPRVCSIDSFFSESMRRDTKIGMTTVFALEMKDTMNGRHTSSTSGNETYIAGSCENDG